MIASVKNLNTDFINKYIIGLNSEMGWRGYSVLINYQSLVSILFPLAPLQLFFSINTTDETNYSVSVPSLRGAKGAVPPPNNGLYPPHFGALKLLFLEHHVTARQQQ